MEFYNIKNYEDFYNISKEGNVFSCNTGSCLKPMKSRKGYLQLELYKNTKRKNVKIHRLVAQTFIPNPQNYRYVKHIDGNKSNNHVLNLQWVKHKSIKSN